MRALKKYLLDSKVSCLSLALGPQFLVWNQYAINMALLTLWWKRILSQTAIIIPLYSFSLTTYMAHGWPHIWKILLYEIIINHLCIKNNLVNCSKSLFLVVSTEYWILEVLYQMYFDFFNILIGNHINFHLIGSTA